MNAKTLKQKMIQTGENKSMTRIAIFRTLSHKSILFMSLILISNLVATLSIIETTAAAPTVAESDTIVTHGVIKFDAVNLRTGPGMSYSQIAQVRGNQRYEIQYRNPESSWVQICCIGEVSGWLDSRMIAIEGDIHTIQPVEVLPPTVAPTETSTGALSPTPTQTPLSELTFYHGWKTAYFDNMKLEGMPIAIEDRPEINFEWFEAPDIAGMPADGFSMRLERLIEFQPGYYRLSIQADDGIRFWIDNELIVDEWYSPSEQTFVLMQSLSGQHQLRVEYVEVVGKAKIRLNLEQVAEAPTWTAAYFANRDLSGTPAQNRRESHPANSLNSAGSSDTIVFNQFIQNEWSARWTGTVYFDGGDYLFHAKARNGVRVYLNDYLLIDNWNGTGVDETKQFSQIGAGHHTVTIESHQPHGTPDIQVWWERR